MRIQRITNLPRYSYNFNNRKNEESPQQTTITNPLNIAFEARVDKGLTRFYEANAERMPKTVKSYIQNLADKTSITPLTAQKNAFIGLLGVTSIAGAQAAFPDEELFSELKETNETKATRGILGIYRENKELLALCEQGILKNNENFTIWLLKKVFLDSKTLDEINQDLEKEINPEFKSIYDQKEKGQFIHPSTLKALGIQLPESEYMQSLRYTRDGYSDIVGDKISVANRNFWDSMPLLERTQHNKKNVEKFENWWNSMSRSQKLDLIAEQMTELDMLKNFNESEFGKTKKTKTSKSSTEEKTPKVKAEKIETSLSRDDLFKIWSGNQLKLFMEGLTEYDKRQIEIKREQKRAEWWNSMSAEERTQYINDLKASSEPIRYAMIDAWNKNPDILAALSLAMKKGYVEKPIDAIYGTEQFNEHLSQIMTDFWANNPEFAERWGIAIHESHEKVKEAVENGRFENLKQNIMKSRAQREKEVANEVKKYKEIFTQEEFNQMPEYMKNFIDAYRAQEEMNIELLPVEYFRDFFSVASSDLTQEQVISWTKALNRKKMTPIDYINIKKINDTEPPNATIMNRALEATLADILYKCTSDSRVYLLSQADCKMALNQIKKGYPHIAIGSLKLDKEFNMAIMNREIYTAEIEKLYKKYKEPISEEAADWIVEQYFQFDMDKIDNPRELADIKDYLKYYIMLYRYSNDIIFSLNNDYTPAAKANFAQKFISNLPDDFPIDKVKLLSYTESDFRRENEIFNINKKLQIKYSFLPKPLFETFVIELNKLLRMNKNVDLKAFENRYCFKLKSLQEHCNAFIMPRTNFSDFNVFGFLSIEQTLADALYKSTKDPKVYALTMEELLLTIEGINTIKKFRNDELKIYSTLLKETLVLNPKSRPNIFNSLELSREYNNELIQYINDCSENNTKFDLEEVLFILNPDENASEIDKYTNLRINASRLSLI